MSYGTLVNQLEERLDNRIIAFDNLPGHGGCILYLEGPVKRIDIERGALERGVDELAAFVRQMMAGASATIERVVVGVRGGALAVM